MLNELKLRGKITIFEHTRFYTKISVIKKKYIYWKCVQKWKCAGEIDIR
jgi:hypothetical protein